MSDTDRCTQDEGCKMPAGHLGPHTREMREAMEEGVRERDRLVADAVRARILAHLDALPQVHTSPMLRVIRETVARNADPLGNLLAGVTAIVQHGDTLREMAQRHVERRGVPLMLPVDHEADERVDRYVASLPRSPSRVIGR